MAELQQRMSSREFAEWAAFYRLEPFGEERADVRAGIVASTVANTVRDPKVRSRPFEPQEFMLFSRATEAEKPDPAEVFAKFKAWALSASRQGAKSAEGIIGTEEGSRQDAKAQGMGEEADGAAE